MKLKISLQVLGMAENVDFSLEGISSDAAITWKSTESGDLPEKNAIEIITDSTGMVIQDIQIDSNIITSLNDLKEAFLAALVEAETDRKIDLADGFEHTSESNSDEPSIENDPYDPKLIRVETKPLSIEYVCKLIASKKLDIAPDFQRGFVWTETKRKSRLIESIMLRIPIPVFYLSQDYEGRYQVVDGIQRLTVISDFINNKFRLKDLEYLKELEGKLFRTEGKPTICIPPMYSSRIEETQLFFNIIDPSTPERVKYDIFRRINTGGKPLNPQEIRNCLSHTNTRQLLKEMVTLSSFAQATGGSISPTRMADKEMATRFAGFYLIDTKRTTNEYNGNMNDFLDSVTTLLNRSPVERRKSILIAFDRAMKNAYILFGSRAFRKTNLINKSLFLSWSRRLADIDPERLKKANLGDQVLDELRRRIKEDKAYLDCISSATNDVQSINKANETASEILRSFNV